VNPPSNSEGSRTQVAKGDLLIVITGAGVTNPALLDHDPGEAYVSQHVGLVRPSDQQLSAWLLLCLMADAGGRSELVERAYGAGKPGLNLDNIRSLSIPLPRLSEQHRIVAEVDALMAIANMIVQLLAVGKTVLFVSQKTTALEVVRRRLNKIGVGDYCLEVHSAKAQKTEVLAQLKTAWERRSDSVESDWTKSTDSLAALRDQLNALVSALHRRRANGMTARQAMGRVIRATPHDTGRPRSKRYGPY